MRRGKASSILERLLSLRICLMQETQGLLAEEINWNKEEV
jgi:hypothetical protein